MLLEENDRALGGMFVTRTQKNIWMVFSCRLQTQPEHLALLARLDLDGKLCAGDIQPRSS